MALGFGSLIDKNIFALNSVNSFYKHLFYYLQLGEDSS